ncbi:MAG: NAD-dependent epimerase/dehydratase family protein, partial [Spirochaetota bacterium]
YHLAKRLLDEGAAVIGIDNLNTYYDPKLKEARLERLKTKEGFQCIRNDIADREKIETLFEKHSFNIVVHLAAQAGVRHSLKNPYSYLDSNLCGLLPILEGCRESNIKHLVFASSSSVYGADTTIPFSAHNPADHPVSLYAATKRGGELLAHSYSILYGIPTTVLRFFTVYGPWGRPDMAYFRFTKLITEGKPIDVYNFGDMRRDFTYIDDIVEGLVRVMEKAPSPDPAWKGSNPDPQSSIAPFCIYNIGRGEAVELPTLIKHIENELGIKAKCKKLPIQSGDVIQTCADISDLVKATGFRPKTSIEQGIKKFVVWYRDYYKN